MFVPISTHALPVVESAKNTKINLIIFDSDGTLVDSELLAAQAIVEHVTEFGVGFTAIEVLDRFKGGKMADWTIAIEALRDAALPASFEPTLGACKAVFFWNGYIQ